MPDDHVSNRDSSSLLRCPLTLAVLLLCLITPGSAQGAAETAAPFAMDSGRAAVAACKVVQSLRDDPRRYRCHVERFEETPTEYIIRVRELPREGTLRPLFTRSRVQIQKSQPSVTVTRVPDL